MLARDCGTQHDRKINLGGCQAINKIFPQIVKGQIVSGAMTTKNGRKFATKGGFGSWLLYCTWIRQTGCSLLPQRQGNPRPRKEAEYFCIGFLPVTISREIRFMRSKMSIRELTSFGFQGNYSQYQA